MASKEEKAKQEERLRQEKKNKQHRELKTYFDKHVSNGCMKAVKEVLIQIYKVRETAQKKAVIKAQEKALLESYNIIREESIREESEKKALKLQQGKELQKFHLAQMVIDAQKL
jgi:hypothetical protein